MLAAPSDSNDKLSIVVELAKKTKKQEPKIFPSLMMIDREAFQEGVATFAMKEFWNSPNTKILLARKSDTKAILGYAIFSVCEMKDCRFK
jgi:hypothetical protein